MTMVQGSFVKGTLFIVSAPSGAGKTSLLANLLEQSDTTCLSISHTTRPIRPGEIDGVNYHFTDRDSFVRQVKEGRFLEHAEVFGNLYGTSADWVETTLNNGMDVILEIDWQGAQQIRRLVADTVSIFVLPPSLPVLEQRLRGRGQDNEDVIAQRLAGAREEISHFGEYDYLVINDDFDRALADMAAIIRADRQRMQRQKNGSLNIIRDLLAETAITQ
jgi:guanylate kinase